MELLERLTSDGPKRILALDGGGVRGALTIGFLEQLERTLRERHGRPSLTLCDYFDLIGGTSIGAIIAVGLAIGMEVAEIKHESLKMAGEVFSKRKWKRWQASFDVKPLEEHLARICGDRTLADSSIRTGLCIVTKRVDTGSTWPLINHPHGKYFKENGQILLRDALRASAAAPVYFVPTKIEISPGQYGAFVDGGVSMASNPALQLLLLATLSGFPFGWPTGEDQLLLVSRACGQLRRESRAVIGSVRARSQMFAGSRRSRTHALRPPERGWQPLRPDRTPCRRPGRSLVPHHAVLRCAPRRVLPLPRCR